MKSTASGRKNFWFRAECRRDVNPRKHGLVSNCTNFMKYLNRTRSFRFFNFGKGWGHQSFYYIFHIMFLLMIFDWFNLNPVLEILVFLAWNFLDFVDFLPRSPQLFFRRCEKFCTIFQDCGRNPRLSKIWARKPMEFFITFFSTSMKIWPTIS